MRLTTALTALALAPTALLADAHSTPVPVEYGARPAYLVDKLPDGDLKDKLASCMGQTASKSDFSIGKVAARKKISQRRPDMDIVHLPRKNRR